MASKRQQGLLIFFSDGIPTKENPYHHWSWDEIYQQKKFRTLFHHQIDNKVELTEVRKLYVEHTYDVRENKDTNVLAIQQCCPVDQVV